MTTKRRYPCTYAKACQVHWCVHILGWSMTQAAITVELNVGTVSHVIHRRRFPTAFPMPLPINLAA